MRQFCYFADSAQKPFGFTHYINNSPSKVVTAGPVI